MNRLLEARQQPRVIAPLAPRVWWFSPVTVSLVVAVSAILSTALLSDREFRLLWRTPKVVTEYTLLLYGAGAVALAFGAMMVIALAPTTRSLPAKWPHLSAASIEFLKRTSTALTAATLVGYAGFGYLIVRSGLSPLQLFSGYGSGLLVRDIIGTIPGITTLTQLGIVAVIVSAVLLMHEWSRVEMYKITAVLALAVLRAFVFSERLAIMELAVPLIVLLVANMSLRGGSQRRLVRFMPGILLAATFATFAIFEYFRSWTFYRMHTTSSYLDFVLSRFAGYYTTALNNGQLVLDHQRWPNRLPYDTIEALWVAPGIESAQLYEKLGGHAPPNTRVPTDSLYNDVLFQFANPEFNNQSGYTGPFADYGPIGGLVCFLLIGLIAGVLYTQFCRGRSFGLFLYPFAFIGLLELPRYFYWSQGRASYVWIGLIVVAVMVWRIETKDTNERIARSLLQPGGR